MITIRAILDTIQYIRSKHYSTSQCWCNMTVTNVIYEYRFKEEEGFIADLYIENKIHLNDFLFVRDVLNRDNKLEIYVGDKKRFILIDILTENERSIKDIIK